MRLTTLLRRLLGVTQMYEPLAKLLGLAAWRSPQFSW